MRVLRTLRLLGVAILPVLALGIAADAQAPRKGGVLRVGNLGEPPTLDAHWTTATLTEVLTNHLYEGLYALDEGYRPDPHARRGDADGVPGRPHLRDPAPPGDQVPQRQGDDVGRRRGLAQAVDAAGEYGKALATVLADDARDRHATPSSSGSSRSTRRSR